MCENGPDVMSEDCCFSDFFSQQHDWILPIIEQPDMPALGFADVGYCSGVGEHNPNMNSYPGPSPASIASPSTPGTVGDGSHQGQRKRKSQTDVCSSFEGEDEDDGVDSEHMKKFARNRWSDFDQNSQGCSRQNHSEIEKRRRDKMNTYIVQLSSMLPMCNAMNRKCDKLTVLRMAVQHMKSLRSSSTSFTEALHKPSFLSDDELKHIILEAADGFLFVVGCDRARILFVSESVSNILQYTRNELIGQSMFDFIHPRDISKVKEQFSSSDLAPRERLIDAKTLMPVKTELPQRPTHLCSGARRSFYCRLKCRNDGSEAKSGFKYEKDDMEYTHKKRKTDQKSYTVIHFNGYLKSWPTSKINITSEDDLEDSSNFLSCLVAVGQIRTSISQTGSAFSACGAGSSLSCTPNTRPVEYMFRISLDGKLTFIDQATTMVLGYLPQELIGTSVYEYYHQDDLTRMAEVHRKVLNSKEKVLSGVYRFKAKNGSFLPIRSTSFSFRNPWTKEVEYIVSTNTYMPMEEVSSSCQGYDNVISFDSNTDCSTEEYSINGVQDKFVIPGVPGGTKPGAGRIGRMIAEEMSDTQRRSRSPALVDSTNSTDVADSQWSVNRLPGGSSQSIHNHNPTLSSVLATSTVTSTKGPNGISVSSRIEDPGCETNSLLDSVIEEQAVDGSSLATSTDEGDEAAMSMIMSLLEADAGLGGPIDFNDLPWPL
ncbi:protein cycle-like isoform X2 [Mya arenaria]|uniref:protein cycle-like isoform X2 n=1 Tax=Mya arenaria TaxID=6604 RepID=UPI0022E0987C|nr:protein cycle-like isoform X2 [Mya arenaria]XP_052799511.1 protein cycle-like isoform X2 [Mya arenaria]XP_052799512.1 protein cycle-like isoform X2 [Mya arenaria]